VSPNMEGSVKFEEKRGESAYNRLQYITSTREINDTEKRSLPESAREYRAEFVRGRDGEAGFKEMLLRYSSKRWE